MDRTDALNAWVAATHEDVVAAAVGVTRRAVRLQQKRGVLPARWYLALKGAGLNPPVEFFSFRKHDASTEAAA